MVGMATTARRPGRTGRRGGTVRGRIGRLAHLGVAVQLQLVVLVVTCAVLVAQDSSHALEVRGAQVAAADLRAGMADQQTGLLTYLKVVQPDSLVLYAEGSAQVESALSRLRSGTAATPDAGSAAQVGAAVRNWQRWAKGLHDQQRPVTDTVDIAQGRHLFGVFVGALHDLGLQLDAESARSGARIWRSTLVSFAVVVADALAVALVAGVFSLQVVRQVLRPLKGLARASEQVAADGLASIPYRDRDDELGDLARALQGWQEAAALRTVMAEEAPVGICRIDAAGRFLTTNGALERMLGYRREELAGRSFREFLHPDDRDGPDPWEAAAGDDSGSRWLRSDGTIVWCSMVTAPVPGADDRSETLVGIMEDITERKRAAERAAKIQRDLLPDEVPRLDGYELAAACLPVRDVTGDFYDWTGPEEGHLDLTIADTATGGPGAALVMAMVRMALRTMPVELDPGARVSLVSESIDQAVVDDGMSLTLFHARLDLASGTLRYVDVGQGCSAIRRADGRMVPLPVRQPTLASLRGEAAQGQVRLGPGDTLVVSTDGLRIAAGGTARMEEMLAGPGRAETAGQMVDRIVSEVRGRQRDDATVLMLRRTGSGQALRAHAGTP